MIANAAEFFSKIESGFITFEVLNDLKIMKGDMLVGTFPVGRPTEIEVPGASGSMIEELKCKIAMGDFTEVGEGIYRVLLDRSIFIFKEITGERIVVVLGYFLEKSKENRISLLHRQLHYIGV